MTVRVRIDRIVIGPGMLEPRHLRDFRAALEAELSRRTPARPGPTLPGPGRPAVSGQAAALGRQVADAVGKRLTRP